MFRLVFFLLFVFRSVQAAPVSHDAVYAISLKSTAGVADSVVGANGTMHYKAQKVCDVWQTETVFSLDVSRELAGVETTQWEQATTENKDGCRLEGAVFGRQDGQDTEELSGRAA